MTNDFEIGKVVEVNASTVTIELADNPKAMAQTTHEGVYNVGQINSYVIIVVGTVRIVALVNKATLVEDRFAGTDRHSVKLPASRRSLLVSMIGTISDGEFTKGVMVFPTLEAPTYIASKNDLSYIFGTEAKSGSEESPYRIPIGQSAIFPEYEIKIDPDAFFGKHTAVLGSTGSGKSCTIATVIQSIIKQKGVKQTRFIIFDANGEYQSAFEDNDKQKWRMSYIHTDPNEEEKERLVIPYWFMNVDDFVRMVQPSDGTQHPTLVGALKLARGGKAPDAPAHFDFKGFISAYIKRQALKGGLSEPQLSNYCSPMITKINQLSMDSRFDFLFGPKTDVKNSLAFFISDLIGVECSKQNRDKIPANTGLPFTQRQKEKKGDSNVVIVDLSLLPSEIVDNITALLGRLILEFLQRIGDEESGMKRGEFPIALVLEEAHNYIKETRYLETDSISKSVFERIAREGRKYGLGLVVSSQRPSEISRTVLSQCNSFVAHQLQNPEDLDYFKKIIPVSYKQLLDQLPVLSPGSALVLGDCVKAPALVSVNKPVPEPTSKNPEFYKSWTSGSQKPDILEITRKWAGDPAKTKKKEAN